MVRVGFPDRIRTEMGRKPDVFPHEQFIKVLRDGLNHLYDAGFLRKSQLAVLFGLQNRFDTPSALQNILINAIESMKPTPQTRHKAYAQAIYDLLLYRYVQQLNQEELAHQFGISVRQLRRQQNQAIFELACLLHNLYHFDELGSSEQQIASTLEEPTYNHSDPIVAELDRLQSAFPGAVTDVCLVMKESLSLIEPLARQKQVELICRPSASGLVGIHPVIFQQLLLNLVSMAIWQTSVGKVVIESKMEGEYLTLEVSCRIAHSIQNLPPEMEKWQRTIQYIVKLSQGRFNLEMDKTRFWAQVMIRFVPPVIVMVIDDNPEMITMMQRFTAETRYQVVGLSEPKRVIEQALQLQPAIIVLDIMMPQVDGLHILTRIKHHPDLEKIPVIVCSVLPQGDLAASLGANDFLQKPIQRDAFITLLDKQVLEGVTS